MVLERWDDGGLTFTKGRVVEGNELAKGLILMYLFSLGGRNERSGAIEGFPGT